MRRNESSRDRLREISSLCKQNGGSCSGSGDFRRKPGGPGNAPISPRKRNDGSGSALASLCRKSDGFPKASGLILVLIVCGCMVCDLFITGDPARMDPAQISQAPGADHWFGTDTLGRDLWSVLWYGGRRSLLIGALATLISTLIAVIYGTAAGLADRAVDTVMMRFSEILLSIPSLLLIIFLQAVIGQRNVVGIAFIIGITGWMSIARMVRTEVRRIRDSEFVLISRMMGGGFFHILRRHLAPNYLSTIMFMVVMNIRSAIVAESTLSFLGLGLPADVITWGSMLSLSEGALLTGAWWIILIPGAMLVVTLLCITSIGEWMRGARTRAHGNL